MSEFLAERIPRHYRHFLMFSKCQFCILHFIFIFSQNGKESACNVGNLGSILGWKDPLEKGKAIHSSILAQRIPRTEEPAELQSVGSQRAGHDWATNTLLFAFLSVTSPMSWCYFESWSWPTSCCLSTAPPNYKITARWNVCLFINLLSFCTLINS